eukprot:TRINITY_DN66365_c10_g1_i1.p1 TRINITY_DN66365_c10_g1~~TRINITY_DN66365_c10_g1_i1.p1  ORF type:complete len:781 (+),score=420.06 TRINITY_DN66365_c10_g1_i1:105-2345(+)
MHMLQQSILQQQQQHEQPQQQQQRQRRQHHRSTRSLQGDRTTVSARGAMAGTAPIMGRPHSAHTALLGDHAEDEEDDDDDDHDDEHRGLHSLLQCFICYSDVREARMCPSCSKICCRRCITKWLTESKSQCPYCRAHLTVSSLIKFRLMDDLHEELSKLRKSKSMKMRLQERCETHRAPLYYFCKTCERAICSDCAMFTKEHTGHEFEHLSKVYARHVARVQQEIANISKRRQRLRTMDKAIDGHMQRCTAAKDECVRELRQVAQEMESRLSAQLRSRIMRLAEQKSDVSREAELMESLEHELLAQMDMSVCSRSAFIKKTPDLLEMLREIDHRPVSQFYRDVVETDFPSEIVPSYDSMLFALPYSEYAGKSHGGIVYSAPLSVNGMSWRLKVYPTGNGHARGEFLSVFLELSAGTPGAHKYQYRVEMLNASDPSKTVARSFSSHFETGECWGYNRFFRIDQLADQGFLRDDGSLHLRFHVRAPTFFFLAQDQQQHIRQLQESLSKQRQKQQQLLQQRQQKLAEQKKKEEEEPETETATTTAATDENAAMDLPSPQSLRKQQPVTSARRSRRDRDRERGYRRRQTQAPRQEEQQQQRPSQAKVAQAADVDVEVGLTQELVETMRLHRQHSQQNLQTTAALPPSPDLRSSVMNIWSTGDDEASGEEVKEKDKKKEESATGSSSSSSSSRSAAAAEDESAYFPPPSSSTVADATAGGVAAAVTVAVTAEAAVAAEAAATASAGEDDIV